MLLDFSPLNSPTVVFVFNLIKYTLYNIQHMQTNIHDSTSLVLTFRITQHQRWSKTPVHTKTLTWHQYCIQHLQHFQHRHMPLSDAGQICLHLILESFSLRQRSAAKISWGSRIGSLLTGKVTGLITLFLAGRLGGTHPSVSHHHWAHLLPPCCHPTLHGHNMGGECGAMGGRRPGLLVPTVMRQTPYWGEGKHP